MQVAAYVNELRDGSMMVEAKESVRVSPDADDNMLFACALEAEADYIVSRNKGHVLKVGEYRGVQTMSPRDFMTELIQTFGAKR